MERNWDYSSCCLDSHYGDDDDDDTLNSNQQVTRAQTPPSHSIEKHKQGTSLVQKNSLIANRLLLHSGYSAAMMLRRHSMS